MTTTVTITGTGIPAVAPDRAGAGVLIQHGELALQIDAGRATAMRLAAAGVEPTEVDAIFLTHYHSDHLSGLQDIVLSHWVQDLENDAGRLSIVAPNGSTVRFCERMMLAWDDDLAARGAHGGGRAPQLKFDLIGFDAPTSLTPVWAKDDVRVFAHQVRHEPVVDAVGYRVETPDGVVVVTGDTIVCDEVGVLARGADVVVYEAMRTDLVNTVVPPSLRYIAEYHADTRELGAQMAELEVPTLMLTHLIPPITSEEQRQGFYDDVREAGYSGDLRVCDDLDRFVLESADAASRQGNQGKQ